VSFTDSHPSFVSWYHIYWKSLPSNDVIPLAATSRFRSICRPTISGPSLGLSVGTASGRPGRSLSLSASLPPPSHGVTPPDYQHGAHVSTAKSHITAAYGQDDPPTTCVKFSVYLMTLSVNCTVEWQDERNWWIRKRKERTDRSLL